MKEDIETFADKVAEKTGCDVFFFRGEISRASALRVEREVIKRRRRKDCLLILVTQGGDPDAAFRIARVFQASYPGKISALIPGWCKSAGTLITLAASTIYIGDLGELGPLDIQLAKPDEIDEAASGLLLETTLRTLETTATRMFINMTRTIRKETGVTTRMAAQVSSEMVVGLMMPVFSQIEPMKIGENARAMSITKAYGVRLENSSRTLRDPQSLEFLIRAYPDHGFVIDRKEATLHYRDVKEPTDEMQALVNCLGTKALYPSTSSDNAQADYLSSEPKLERSKNTGDTADVQTLRRAGANGPRRRGGSKGSSGARVAGQPNRANGSQAPTTSAK